MTTLAQSISEISFDVHAEELNDSKLARLKLDVNSRLRHVVKTIETDSEKIAAGKIDSFVLDSLITTKAELEVYSGIAHIIWNMTRTGQAEDTILSAVYDHAVEFAVMSWRINSTSNSSVELELAVKVAWGQFLRDVKYL